MLEKIKTFKVKNDYGDILEKSLSKIESSTRDLKKSKIKSKFILFKLKVKKSEKKLELFLV